MFKKALFIAALSGAIISSGALTATAEAQPEIRSSSSMFNLSALDPTQKELAQAVITEFDFDWTLLRPALRQDTGNRTIRVRVREIERWKALGLTWPSGLIEMDDDVTDPYWFQRVFRHELGHAVDFFLLGPTGARGKVAKLYGESWKEMWHDFNDGFTQAASTFPVEDAGHHLTEEALLELRNLLGLSGPVPLKVASELTATADWRIESPSEITI